MNEADPRVKRTRKLIVDAFFSLLAEKSLHSISVQDIAERATVNRATFYTHFEDKFALMDWIVRDTFREALTQRLGTSSRFTLDSLRLLVVTVCEFMSQFHGHCAPGDRTIGPEIEVKVQEELVGFLSRWLAPATPPGSSKTAATLLSWSIFGAGVEWATGERRVSAEEWAREVVELLVGGVAAISPSVEGSPQTEPVGQLRA